MNLAPLKHLQSQTIIITGASSGIGRQLAFKLANQNANLILIARNQTKLVELTQQCQVLSDGTVDYYSLDISVAKHVKTTFEDIQNKHKRIEILINAAGFGDFTQFNQTDYALWHKMFKVNVLGTMLLTRYAAQMMMEQKLGQIINLGSMGGKIATPKSAVYSATKAAVIAFSDALRLELRPFNVQVTTINPGPVETEFFQTADHTGQYLKSIGGLKLQPQQLAEDIIHCIGRPVRELNRPQIMQLAYVGYQLFPYVGDWLTARFGNQK
ncbi:SDR family oxidoreductase [Bombilactobacillus folatiphilus]|uniref:SDR family oxidoreductase n=1 Tax=Bombilactobacillus folatiphilus TaxID=2923362 RepID=A0ABY4PAR3_9LACO|nr:SDR family oxidoreductase [Bombilactobacillus folatiphilus]UQS82763.1 SDR family oxidoreductase [Bombilactobacillus folatiphilus]